MANPSNQWLQAKLKVGPVDDPLEREADRVADALIGGNAAGPGTDSAAGILQRQPAPTPTSPPPPEQEPLRPLVTTYEIDTKTDGQKLGKGAGEALDRALDTPAGKALQDAAEAQHDRNWQAASPSERAVLVGTAIGFGGAVVALLKAVPESEDAPPAPTKTPKFKLGKDVKVQLELKYGWKDVAPDGTEMLRRTPRIDSVTVNLFYAPEGPKASSDATPVAAEIAGLEKALRLFRPKVTGDRFAVDYATRRMLEERRRRPSWLPSAAETARNREADRFKLDAGPFGAMPRPGIRLVPELELESLVPPGQVQRKCAACAGAEDETVRRKAAGSGHGSTAAAVAGLGGGTALPAAERAFFEPRLGRDLSAVRLHHEAPAAVDLGARAFTLGRDIAFAPGEWRPGTLEGRRLLAHELVHVVQQGKSGEPLVQRQANPIDKDAQALIDLAQDTTKTLKWRALELVWRMLTTYFPKRSNMVAGVSFDEAEPGLSITFRGKAATRVGLITVGRNFVDGTTKRQIARRVAQLDHELTHIEQQRAGMAGANRSDEREFLAFAEEAAFTERPGTGTIPNAMRVTLVDGALGFLNCLSAALQKQYASRQQALLTLRAKHDGKSGNSSTKPPTTCRRVG